MKIKHVNNKRFLLILSPQHRIPAASSWIRSVDFVSKKKEEKKKRVFVVLEERKKERKKPRIKRESCQLVE